jgi:hypothetical protein
MRLRPVDQYFESFMTQQPYPRCPVEPYSPITLYGNVLFLVQDRERQINKVLPIQNSSSPVKK